MKFLFTLCSFLLPLLCFSQKLTLQISTPQPRLGEEFNISINIDTITASVFGFLSDKFSISGYKGSANQGSILGANLQAIKLGRNEIGPLTLKINGKTYLTDKIIFDVVDSLPMVNKGIWIRQAREDDSTRYLIIEQRIPALTYISHSGNSINMTTKSNEDDVEIGMIEDADLIRFAGSNESYQSFKDPKTGAIMNYKSFSALYEIKINQNGKIEPVTLTKDNFKNVPDYYQIKNIAVK